MSLVTDFWRTFEGASRFAGDVSKWDVSSARRLSRMFEGAEEFDGRIGEWRTGNVGEMNAMFKRAKKFRGRGGIDKWDTSGVKDLREVFDGADSFTGDLKEWSLKSLSKPSRSEWLKSNEERVAKGIARGAAKQEL